MWPNIITGAFTLGGVALGVLLEPLKAVFSSRARTRQHRGERAGEVIRCATVIRRNILALNADYRARKAGDRQGGEEQKLEKILAYNTAIAELRDAIALLRLHGPDKVADAAERVFATCDGLLGTVNEPDDGPYRLEGAPRKLREADAKVDKVVKEFAILARRSTR